MSRNVVRLLRRRPDHGLAGAGDVGAEGVMLQAVQQILQRLYGIEVAHDVADFVITDARLARCLGGERAADAPEKLLIRQQDGELELSLYLDAGLCEAARRDSPLTELHGRNIGRFCVVLEGVSHFLYLAWRAAADRPVSLLELELQAEVDKYAVLALLLKTQRRKALPPWLRRWLFQDIALHATLDGDEIERYLHANHFARRYCRHLERRFAWNWNGLDLVSELRRFYRLGQAQKIRLINSAC